MSLKKVIKVSVSVMYYIALSLMLVVKNRLKPGGTKQLVVLYYHGVSATERKEFARQLDVLKRIATVVPADWSGDGKQKGLHVAITFDDAFANLLDNAVPELASRAMVATIFVPTGQLGCFPTWDMKAEDKLESDRIMTRDELVDAVSQGMILGSHTVSHPRLTSLPDDDLRRELVDSREFLKSAFGLLRTEIAFPYGDFNSRVLQACREAGYSGAYSIVPAIMEPSNGEFLRGRIQVFPDDGLATFFLKANGAYSWMRHASRIKRMARSRLDRSGSDPFVTD